LKEYFISSRSNSLHHKEKEMFDFRKIVLALIVFAVAIPMVSAQEGPDNLPFNCRLTSTPPLVRIEGVAELAGDILISCSGIVPNQGLDGQGRPRDLRANVTLTADVQVTSRATGEVVENGRLLTDALLINSGDQGRCADPFNCAAPAAPSGTTTGYIGQGAPYVGGGPVFTHPYVSTKLNHGKFAPPAVTGDSAGRTLEWDDVLLAPGSAQGKQWYMQLRITNVRLNAAEVRGLGEFAPGLGATVTLNTTTGTVPLTPDYAIIARPRPSFRVESAQRFRRNCDNPKVITQYLDIIELLPNAFKPRVDDEVNQVGCNGSSDQCNPNTAYFTESGLMLDSYWATTAPTPGNTGVADQATSFNIRVISPSTLDYSGSAYTVSVLAGRDADVAAPAPALTSTAGTTAGTGVVSGTTDVYRDFTIRVDNFRLDADPFTINRLRVPIRATYDETLYGATQFQVWYVPLATAAQQTVAIGAPVPRFALEVKEADGYVINRCRTLLLFPYITNRDGYNTGIAIANTSYDDAGVPVHRGPFPANTGASAQTGPCTLYLYGGNNGPDNPVGQEPLESDVNVPAGGMYLMTLQHGGVVKGPAGQNVGTIGAAPGFQGYAIASCEFQFAHGYAFISDTNAQVLAQGYLALIIPDRVSFPGIVDDEAGSEYRPASPFNLGIGALSGGEQLVH
jgi:hypothetical protein